MGATQPYACQPYAATTTDQKIVINHVYGGRYTRIKVKTNAVNTPQDVEMLSHRVRVMLRNFLTQDTDCE